MDFEEILAQLTESQIDLLVRFVRSNMRPADAKEDDNRSLLKLGLFERQEIHLPPESYTGKREHRTSYGPPIPSDLGREWVAWYVSRK